jgi:glycosyltransferase involved in cell wall biosynthesis
MNALTTFVVPTIGRRTLVASIESLIEQTDPAWRAIVIFDGIAPHPLPFDDPRIVIKQINKAGISNHGGAVRNCALKIADTDWISFLDDDDTITTDYVARLREEIELRRDLSVVIFRAITPRGQILPCVGKHMLTPGDVGISFSIKSSLIEKGYQFEPGSGEDYWLLNFIGRNGVKMVVSPYATYRINGCDKKKSGTINTDHRVYINDGVLSFITQLRFLRTYILHKQTQYISKTKNIFNNHKNKHL